MFSVVNKDDGLHYSHPWVVGVQEEIERMRKRLDDAEEEIKGVWNLKFQIQTLQVIIFSCYFRRNLGLIVLNE